MQIWIKFSLPVRWSSFLIPALKVQPVCLHGSGPLPNKSGEVGKCPLKSKSRPGRKRLGRPCHCAERVVIGDSDRTARAIAAQVGVDRCFAEVLPEDKAAFVRDAKAEGYTVVMIGDGINDSPALSAADIGIAMLHNLSTLGISLRSMTDLLEQKSSL